MKKIGIFIGGLVILLLGGVIGQSINVNATSKVELEELVQKQQVTIDHLTTKLDEVSKQLSDTTKRLEVLENKESSTEEIETRLTKVESVLGQWDSEMSVIQYLNDLDNRYNKRVLLLEKIHKVDHDSIQQYVTNFPQLISDSIDRKISSDSYCWSGCTYPIQKDSLVLDPASFMLGSFNFNVLDYISEEKIKEIALNAYNQQNKVTYNNIQIYIVQPFDLTYKIIDIPLQ